jgi:cysteine desulfurase/selenocysteine lyase
MSDAINGPNGLPEVRALEILANELFSALPGGYTSGPVPAPEVLPRQHDVGRRDGGRLPATAIHQGNAVDLQNPQTSLPDSNGLGLGHIPRSTSGSGGISGHSPNVKPYEQLPYQPAWGSSYALPFESETPFEQQLKQALQSVNVSSPSAQLPYTPSGVLGEHSYYFSSPFQFSSGLSQPAFNVNLVRNDFPILAEQVNGKQLIWLDNAATTQKPKQVMDRLSYFYAHENSNIHRAAHELAARATDAYEGARQKIQRFINAKSANEIVFVRGTTEAINLVAGSWGEQYLQQGDEIIITHLEHHANIVPWQLLAKKKDLKIRVIPVDDDGQVLLDEYARLLNPRTKLVAFTLVSNALGTATPAKQIVDMAHAAGARVLADGAQSVSHIRTDVQQLDADWFVFSGHKIFGPTGIGVLYAKEGLLNSTQPYQGGGNMIKDVTFEHTEFHDAPSRFEAGTGNIADAVGLGAAIDYVQKIGIDNIYEYEHFLLKYATQKIQQIPGLRQIGTAANKTSVLSFVLNGYTTAEVGEALSREGIAVRSGHHCAQPILRRFGLEATVRPSLAFYNTCAEIDALVNIVSSLKQR